MSLDWNALSVQISTPLLGTAGVGEQLESATPPINSYSHKISASAGFESASIDIAGDHGDAEDWLTRLGYHVVVLNEFGVNIWEGFIDKVAVTIGPVSITRGPMIEIPNKVAAIYQTPSYTIAGITIGGIEGITSYYEDDESQAKYGVLEEIVNIGTASSTEADQIAQTYLKDNADPAMSQSVSSGSARGISIKLECAGYFKFLERYIYRQVVTAGTMNLSDKIEAVLAADPNTIISTDYTNITANTTLVGQYEDENGSALDAIAGLVAMGDSNFNRYIWGVYQDRLFHYAAVPTDVEYSMQLTDRAQRIVDIGEAIVQPWNIVPGKWLRLGDFLVGERLASTLRQDPKLMLIESVSFTAPTGLSLAGGKVDDISQRMARLGIGGIAQP